MQTLCGGVLLTSRLPVPGEARDGRSRSGRERAWSRDLRWQEDHRVRVDPVGHTPECEPAAHVQPHAPSVTQKGPLPYASLSVPVYSLVTKGSKEASRNGTMNLVTYAIPVSIEPRQFEICLLRSTLSFENFVHHGEGVLQVREPDDYFSVTFEYINTCI
jgi:hypothetical protein